jgi:UDP-N-acetylglucosamine 4,6-dehydratase
MLNEKSILITGGTGSFGKAFVKTVLERYPGVRRLVVFSRDELKQFEMAQQFPESKYRAMRYFIGDVRDSGRLQRAMEGIDFVVHAAALKQVPAAEYNPFECIKTNVLGAQNVIEACLDSQVQPRGRAVDRQGRRADQPLRRHQAVLGQAVRGRQQHQGQPRPALLGGALRQRDGQPRFGDPVLPGQAARAACCRSPTRTMTRFNISLQEGVDMVLWAIEHAWGGEVLVPKIPSYRITDVAEAIGPDCAQRVIGIRPGEKIHEEMITASDSGNTVDIGRFYAILPCGGSVSRDDYIAHYNARPVPQGFTYDSGSNPDFLNVPQLRELIAEHVQGVSLVERRRSAERQAA